MEANYGANQLQNFLENEHPSNVREVGESMGRLRPLLRPAGFKSVEEFLGTYHAVTTNIADKVNLSRTEGVSVFREEEVLNAATPIFFSLFTENLVDTRPHWSWIRDERAHQVDQATRGVLGYASHIGGDLGLTVHSVRASGRFSEQQIKNYLRYDYAPKIDLTLWKTAHQMAPVLTNIENKKVEKALTNIFMLGVISGRQLALIDAKRMAKAKSFDHQEAIAESARTRTARLTEMILSRSLELNQWAALESGRQMELKPTIIDLRESTSQKIAKFIGSSLRKAA